MHLCYLLTLLTIASLAIVGLQGYLQFFILKANHPTFALFTIILYLFTQTLIMFFFVGTGVSLKEYTRDHKMDESYHKRALQIKRVVYPPMLWNILFIMVTFILGGAVHTKIVPTWLHSILFFLTFFHFIKTVCIEHNSFKINVEIYKDLASDVS